MNSEIFVCDGGGRISSFCRREYPILPGQGKTEFPILLASQSLRALAEEAVRRGTGARALRSIFERMMLDVMYEIPSRDDIESVTINRQVVTGERPPIIRKRRDKAA